MAIVCQPEWAWRQVELALPIVFGKAPLLARARLIVGSLENNIGLRPAGLALANSLAEQTLAHAHRPS